MKLMTLGLVFVAFVVIVSSLENEDSDRAKRPKPKPSKGKKPKPGGTPKPIPGGKGSGITGGKGSGVPNGKGPGTALETKWKKVWQLIENLKNNLIALQQNGAINQSGLNTCGCAKPLGTSRIVGGKEVTPANKYPYQIWVQGKGACGGSIINKKYILSAAHCFGKPGEKDIKVTENNYVMIGTNDMMGVDGQFLMIEKIIMHPGYNNDMGDDVAIIKLSEEIKFSKKVMPVCLAANKDKDYTGKMATVTGWGTTKGYEPGAKVPESPEQYIMKETSVKVLKNSEPMCEVATGGDTKTRFCAWAKKTGSCQGDSGGPLTVVEDGKFVQIGIVSYSAGCGTKTVEGASVYARVTNYVDWIQKVTADGNC